MEEAKSFVFTYGTLKQGFCNSPILADQKYLGQAYTKDARFRLHNIGWFPGLVELEEGGMHVYGEIYELTKNIDRCKQTLDRLEGINHTYPEQGLYTKKEILFINEKDEEVQALAYFWGEGPNTKHVACGSCWPTKDTNKFIMAHHRVIVSDGKCYLKFKGEKSPEFKELELLSEWAADNTIAFGNKKLDKTEWQSLLQESLG